MGKRYYAEGDEGESKTRVYEESEAGSKLKAVWWQFDEGKQCVCYWHGEVCQGQKGNDNV